MVTYSIIIPHKNCPSLLERCIDSIPVRSEIQIIVVDDKSGDIAPLKALEEKKQGQIELYYTNEGRGAGYARNIGLAKAKGEWLLFADADDYFDKDAFSCFDSFKDIDADIVVFKHRSVFSESGEETKRSDTRNEFIDAFLREKTDMTEARLRFCNDVPWAKMIKRSLIEKYHVLFDEVPASNDTMFSLMAGYHASLIVADKSVVYNVTVRQGSITKTKSIERYLSDHHVALRKNEFLRKIGHGECQERIISRMIIILKLFGFKEFLKFCKSYKQYGGRLF